MPGEGLVDSESGLESRVQAAGIREYYGFENFQFPRQGRSSAG